jgi:hypothetical protein
MTSPEQRDYALSFRLAAESLAKQHPQEIARRSGAFVEEFRGRVFLEVEVLGQRCVIPHPRIDVRPAGSREELPLWTKVLILHYLEKATGVRLSGDLITFQEVESGTFYLPIYRERVLRPMLDAFGHRPEALVDAAKRTLNGQERDHGDLSVTVFALPYVPVTPVLWRGDDEFPPDGTVLFDATVSQYLETEDITLLTQMLVQKLVQHVDSEGG